MYFVGIDVAKKAHSVGVRRDDGSPHGRAFEFGNDEEGFRLLLGRLAELGVEPDGSIVAMEATGQYWMALYCFLTDRGFGVAVANPSLVSGFRNASTVRKTKTDAIDCFLIADFARFKGLEPSRLDPEDAHGLRALTRYRAGLVEVRTGLKNRCTAIIDRVFPELGKLFPNDLYAATPMALLKRFPAPGDVAAADIRTIAKVVREASNGYHGRAKAEEVKRAAKASVGSAFAVGALSFEIRAALEHIEFLDGQIKGLEGEIERRLEETCGKWLETIPGIGATLAAAISAEVGDPFRFEDAKKLVAYAGIDPSHVQSGGFCGTEGKMSKRGSRHLRRALMIAADKVRLRDPCFKRYYESLVARGKHHYVALSGVARKLCGVILAVMKEERAYEERPSRADA